LKIKNKYPAIKWIADLRDPWTDIYYYKQFYPTFISKYIDQKLEESVLKNADKIITVGDSLKNLFSLKIKGTESKTEVITNGYDEDDFSGITATIPEIFTITYVGTLSDIYPVSGFLDSLKIFKEKGNEFKLRFIGTVSQNQKELIRSVIGDSSLEFIPYVEHIEAIKFLFKTSVLLLIIPDHQSNKSIITGKIFEYIASGKPIICIGPVDGDAARIIEDTGHGRTFSYIDCKGISEYLSTFISDLTIKEKTSPAAFSRRELTEKISQLLSDRYY
jgi:glycosyltransferase involved in cell wall biosynthesis